MASGAVWRNRDIEGLRTALNARVDLIRARGEELMERITAEAAEEMQRIILASTTPTGDRRVENGGRYAGRYVTGEMYNDVLSSVEVSSDGKVITGRFGWLKEWEDYYLYQEGGTGKIKAMHALLSSFIHAREKLRAELATIAGKEWNP